MAVTDDATILIKKLRSKGCKPEDVIADGQIVLWAVSIGLDGIRLDDALSYAVTNGWLVQELTEADCSKLTQIGYESSNV